MIILHFLRLHPAVFLLSLLATSALSETSDKPDDPPCTATSALTGTFVDLRPLKRTGKGLDWFSRGWDYGANFTLNICEPVVTVKEGFRGVEEGLQANVSAYYEKDEMRYSIGQTSEGLKFRGRKLVLEYTDGSPCPGNTDYKKSTTMSFMCDSELAATASISFVGQQNDCSYFFEVRTSAACPTSQEEDVSPLAVFGVIGLVAFLVYCIGGCVYQRTVLHQRGWRQIPHYSVWAGAANFLWTSLIRVTNTIIGCLPIPARYKQRRQQPAAATGGYGNRGFGAARGRYSDEVENDNRILDQLDDEWGADF